METGGISRGAVIDGGYQLVEGTAENSVMYDGSQIVDGGRLSEGTVNGGGLSFSSGGRGENIVLNDGGVIAFENSSLAGMTVNGGNLLVSGGAEISDLSQTGGSTLLEEGSVVSGTTRLTGGELKVQGAAEIPDLELAGARVDLVADNQYSKLTIGRLNGEGKFYLNSEVAASHSDELEVQNGHGSFGIAMTDRSYEEVFPIRFILCRITAAMPSFICWAVRWISAPTVTIFIMKAANGCWSVHRSQPIRRF